MNRLISLLFLVIISPFVSAGNPPKLIVGLVVDQMRADYLQRFDPYFGDNGFRRLVKNGVNYSNAHYGYAVTHTGPGHATIYTGVNPSQHGIVSNVWIDRSSGRPQYCVDDSTIHLVPGTEWQRKSPRHLMVSGLGDQIRAADKDVQKVVSIAMKDRSAILPGGQNADVALWWDDQSGNWTSSPYYGQLLPPWLNKFSEQHPYEQYLKVWETSVDDSILAPGIVSAYKSHNKYEEPFKGKDDTEFPYDFKALAEAGGKSVLKSSPFGNTYTFDLARTAVVEEKLGKDHHPDLLAVSLSSTDYIGHRFAPESREVMDCYARLDKDIADFLSFLDSVVGEENYALFLTADHGAMSNVQYLIDNKFPAAIIDYRKLKADVNAGLKSTYGIENAVAEITNTQVYFDEEVIRHSGQKPEALQREVLRLLLDHPSIACAFSAYDLEHENFPQFPVRQIQNSFYSGRSGDVMFATRPMTGDFYSLKGADHGSPYEYDTHVPLIFYGCGFEKGLQIEKPADVTSITPTICRLLSVSALPACSAPVLGKALKPEKP